jgi:hypothetical protein
MPRVRFEPTIPVFERAKAVHASDRMVTVIDGENDRLQKCLLNFRIDIFLACFYLFHIIVYTTALVTLVIASFHKTRVFVDLS